MNDVHTQVSRDLAASRRDQVVSFAAAAVRIDAHCIGWLPFEFYEAHDAAGRLVSVTRNGDLVGFVCFSKPNFGLESKIIQVWVRKDARQIEHGRALTERAAQIAADLGAAWLTCWVAQDLEAMRFWPAIGFESIAQRVGRGSIAEFAKRRTLTQFARRCRRLEYLPCPKPTPVQPSSS